MKRKVFAEIAGELLNTTNSNFRGIVQVIDDDGPVTAEEELKNGVAANVASSTGDKNWFRHNHTKKLKKEIERLVKKKGLEMKNKFIQVETEEY